MISIIDHGARACYLCGATSELEVHHIYLNALRSKSEQYGLKVTLCANCHRHSAFSVHNCKATRRYLQKIGQITAMEVYGWDNKRFKREFYRDYLEGEDDYELE